MIEGLAPPTVRRALSWHRRGMDSKLGELSRTFKLTTLWLLLGALVFVGVQAGLARRDSARFSVEAQSGAIELRRSADGH